MDDEELYDDEEVEDDVEDDSYTDGEETFIDIELDEIEDDEDIPVRTYRMDWDKGRIIGMVDGAEAVNQAIRKELVTRRFKNLIYSEEYGTEIHDAIIAGDATPEYIETVIEGFIEDALKPDSRVENISDIDIALIDDKAYVSFTVETVFGDVEIEEVI